MWKFTAPTAICRTSSCRTRRTSARHYGGDCHDLLPSLWHRGEPPDAVHRIGSAVLKLDGTPLYENQFLSGGGGTCAPVVQGFSAIEMGSAGAAIRACEGAVMCCDAVHQRPSQAEFAVRSGACAGSGWRRSADQTCLQAYSLLSGNLSRKFVISGLSEPIAKGNPLCCSPRTIPYSADGK